jgi:hypothetical protein
MTYPADESFRKSSYSNGPNTACIEVANTAETFFVRDSKDRSGPVLSFGMRDWEAFLILVR